MKKHLFISIKKQYTDRILEGSKDIELRKVRPNIMPGDHVIIYCTSPVKAIVGIADVKEIICVSPSEMWKRHSRRLGIERSDYDSYFDGFDKAIGIVLSNVQELSCSICLSFIREQLPSFMPPQTYRYFMKFTTPDSVSGFQLVPNRQIISN